MADYFVLEFTLDLTKPKTEVIPVGVSAYERDSVEVRLVNPDDLPPQYKMDPLTREFFEGWKELFIEGPPRRASGPTTFRPIEVKEPHLTGTLAERAQQLFERRVVSFYNRNPTEPEV